MARRSTTHERPGFEPHKVVVGLSVDGPRVLHDTYRVDKRGKGSFADVMRGWQRADAECCVRVMGTAHPQRGAFSRRRAAKPTPIPAAEHQVRMESLTTAEAGVKVAV